MINRSLVFGVLTTLAFSANAVSYMQPDNIDEKVFKNVLAADGSCDLDARDFTGENETRTFSKSSSGEYCYDFEVYKYVSENYLTNIGRVFNSSSGSSTLAYDPGIPILVENMDVGEYWQQTSEVRTSFDSDEATLLGNRTDVFAAVALEDLSLEAGEFQDCLRVEWDYSLDYASNSGTYHIWFCEDVGLVKYLNLSSSQANSWELQSIKKEYEPNPISYVQSEQIGRKIFRDTEAVPSSSACDISMRDYEGENEVRTESSTQNSSICETRVTHKVVDENSVTITAFDIAKSESVYIHSMVAGIPIIIEDMGKGKTWSAESEVYSSFENTNKIATRNDIFTVLDIEDLSVQSGDYSSCAKLEWEVEWNGNYVVTYHLWFCEDVGLVKYSNISDQTDDSFELQVVTTKAEMHTESIGGFDQVFLYTPETTSTLNDKRSLMIMLDGCRQTSSTFLSSNFDKVAKENGMVVALPEGMHQNQYGCWGSTTGNDAPREHFDFDNIISLVDELLEREELNVDVNQVYIAGFSSGAIFAMDLGCRAPDVFAGVGIGSGLSVGAGYPASLLTPEEVAGHCLNIAGEKQDYFSTQITAVSYGPNDEVIIPAYSHANADAMALIYGVDLNGSNPLEGGTGAIETLWGDESSSRVSSVEFNQLGHVWSGGPGAFGFAISDASINYADYLAKFFTQNNTRYNQAPVITGEPQISVYEGQEYFFIPNAVDPNNDVLSYSIENKPSWTDFNEETGQLSGIPGYDDAQEYEGITISVSDGEFVVSLAPFSIDVQNTNRAPSITGTPASSVEENQLYGFTPDANDLDGDSLTFSILNKPSWADFDEETGQLSGTPGYDDAQEYEAIAISVSDGEFVVSLPSFSISVQNLNRAPSITGTPMNSVEENQLYDFTPDVTDLDEDPLIFSIQNKPSWAIFDEETGQLTGTPGDNDAGIYENIIITVSDGSDLVSLEPFNIEVINVENEWSWLTWLLELLERLRS